MPGDKIDWQRLAREADAYAADQMRHNPEVQNTVVVYRKIRDEHFARLVLEEAAKVCLGGVDGTHAAYADACHTCATLIRSLMP